LKLVERTAQTLEILAAQPDGAGVVRVAELLGEPVSTVHRLLGALASRGFVYKEASTRRYFLGSAILKPSHAYQQHDLLAIVARRHIAALSARTMESVFFSELIGDDVICVSSAESPRPLSFYMRPGQRTPYHAGSSARAVLAFRPIDEQLRLLRAEKFERYTHLTLTSVDEALAELRRTRERGYAVCDQEMEAGVTAIAAPVRNAIGEVAASITLVATQHRLAGEARQEAVGFLQATATQIAVEVGYSGHSSAPQVLVS
jgi:IclR family acetate operon transcriptional repressor